MHLSLRRRRRTELVPKRSFTELVKSKVCSNGRRENDFGTRTCEYDSLTPSEPELMDLHDLDRSLSRYFRCCRPSSEYFRPHPIFRLPVELISHIFVLGAEDDLTFPITVSHVNRTWRHIALNTPTLWRRISLDSRFYLWAEHIRRSRACTLDVEIVPRDRVPSRTVQRFYLDARTVQRYMHLVAPHIPRWRTFTVEFQHYAPYLWNAALSPCCGYGPTVQATKLKHLTLIYPNNDDPKEFTLFNGYAPRLRSATLEGVRLSWLPSLFSNLTVLDYTHHGFTRGQHAAAELFEMLSACPRLTKLRLAFSAQAHKSVHSRLPPVPANASLHLPHLHRLTLHVDGSDIPSALIYLTAHLSLPSLRSLYLLTPAPAPITSNSRLYAYTPTNERLPRPFPRLQHFVRVLPRMDRLTYLVMAHSWFDMVMINYLRGALPRLSHLTVHAAQVDDGSLWSLGEVLRERSRTPVYPQTYAQVLQQPNTAHDRPQQAFLSTLNVIEFIGARLTGEGVTGVVRRMLGSGVLWTRELWLRDCPGIDGDLVRRVWRYGIRLRVWIGGAEVRREVQSGSGLQDRERSYERETMRGTVRRRGALRERSISRPRKMQAHQSSQYGPPVM